MDRSYGEEFDRESYVRSNTGGRTVWRRQRLVDPEAFRMPMTQVWVRCDARWRLLAGHAGPTSVGVGFVAMDSRTILEAVDDAFVTTGAGTPPWPDPHEGMEGPRDEEYSRCLDCGKYRILKARADAWVLALTRLGLAVVEEIDEPEQVWRDQPPRVELDQAIWLRPVRVGAIPLLLGFWGPPDADTTLYVGVGEPAVLALLTPGCGCDACDDGSDRLLGEVDEHLLSIVNGDFVHLVGGRNTVMSTGAGWSASGRFAETRRDVEALLSEARDGRSKHRVVHGARWW